jgi:hypothetical protein
LKVGSTSSSGSCIRVRFRLAAINYYYWNTVQVHQSPASCTPWPARSRKRHYHRFIGANIVYTAPISTVRRRRYNKNVYSNFEMLSHMAACVLCCHQRPQNRKCC